MPQVSVVIPTFGRPHLVERAIASALDQTLSDLEVIVVVDGPDPGTRAVIARRADPRLRCIEHPEQRGAAAARDTGVAASQGAWIAFLDDDDTWMPTKLAAQVSHAPDHPTIVSTLSLVGTPDAWSVKPAHPYDGSMSIDEWLFGRATWLGGGGFLQCSSLMVSRSVFATLRFSDTRDHDDWEFAIRAVKQVGCAFVTVPEPLVIHLFDASRTSLQSTLTWRISLNWALSMRALLTPRALSGFLLTVAARSAANAGAPGAALPLVVAAFRAGQPTARQLFAFILLWLVPRSMRRALRHPSLGPGAAPTASLP